MLVERASVVEQILALFAATTSSDSCRRTVAISALQISVVIPPTPHFVASGINVDVKETGVSIGTGVAGPVVCRGCNNLVTGFSRSLGYCPNVYMYARGNSDNYVSRGLCVIIM